MRKINLTMKTEFEEDSDFTVETLETIYGIDFKLLRKTDKTLEFRVSNHYIKYENQGQDPDSGIYVVKILSVIDGSNPIELTKCGDLGNTTFALLTGVPLQ